MAEGLLKTASENPVAAKIRKAIGVGPNAPVRVGTPQIERPAHWPAPACPPRDHDAFYALRGLNTAALRELGLQPWDAPKDGEQLWLFPAEWFSHIPFGLPVTDIFGKTEPFSHASHDADSRYGTLSFGVEVLVADDQESH